LNIYYHITRPEIFAVLDAMRQVTGVRPDAARPAPNACTCPHCTGELAVKTPPLQI
jgi:hypothetical protein